MFFIDVPIIVISIAYVVIVNTNVIVIEVIVVIRVIIIDVIIVVITVFLAFTNTLKSAGKSRQISRAYLACLGLRRERAIPI